MKSKILFVLFITMISTIALSSCDYYYRNHFYIDYVYVDYAPVYVPDNGGTINVRASVGNYDWYTDCHYEIIASTDRYYSYNDRVLYSGSIYLNHDNEIIDRLVSIPSTFSSGSYYVGVVITNSWNDEVRFTDYIAFQKYDVSPTGTLIVINDSSEDVDVYVDNQFVGSIYSGNTLSVYNVLYGSRKLYAEARYSNNVWGPRTINFNGSYYWTLNDQSNQNNITFDSYTNETIDVYLDGDYMGTLYPYDAFTVYDVGTGYHRLKAESYYGYWGPTWIYLDPGESYTWELWP